MLIRVLLICADEAVHFWFSSGENAGTVNMPQPFLAMLLSIFLDPSVILHVKTPVTEINLLTSSSPGPALCTTRSNIQKFYMLLPLCLCVVYETQNRQ